MRILITGHLGFVAKHLSKLLYEHGYQLQGADKKAKLNVNSTDFFLRACKYKPDLIVHLAANCSTAKSLENPVDDFWNNAFGTVSVCEIARITGAKVLYTSTCKIQPNGEGVRTPYGLSKYVGELYLKEYSKLYGFEYVINRPGTIYGPGQEGSPESGWLAWFLKAKKENLPITIYGDGNQSRDILWVGDYVSLLEDQIKGWQMYRYYGKDEDYTWDVGGGKENEISLLRALKFIDYNNYTFAPPRPGDIKRFVADNEITKIRGWKPKMKWNEGIKKLL